jgi:Lrp/AsnC family transcriptional regulator, leucine-responsive regulatory protein
LRTDPIDRKIIAALMDDGRASFRKIAQRTSLTTPTVSARVARMTKAGLIERFIPVLSVEPIAREISALVTVRVSSGSPEKLSSSLAKLPEVQDAYLTTGQCVTVKLNLRRPQELQSFLGRAFMEREGAEVISSQIVTRIVKEEPRASAAHSSPYSSSLSLAGMASMDLRCDHCHGEVASSRPYTMSVGSSHYYFCCKTCKKDYLDSHRSRLAKLGIRGGGPLHP